MPHSGTWRPLFGLEPTGRSCVVDEMPIFRVSGHLIAEIWEI